MTDRQREVLAHIVHCHKQGGPLPSGRELMDKFYWSSSATARDHFIALEEKGAIRRKNGAKRYGLILSHPVVAELMGDR
jgi:SOS-response transcriptional repressor LexA